MQKTRKSEALPRSREIRPEVLTTTSKRRWINMSQFRNNLLKKWRRFPLIEDNKNWVKTICRSWVTRIAVSSSRRRARRDRRGPWHPKWKRNIKNKKSTTSLSLPTIWIMSNTWRTMRFGRRSPLLRTGSRRSEKMRSGRRTWPRSGTVLERMMLSRLIKGAYTHTVSQLIIFEVVIYFLLISFF